MTAYWNIMHKIDPRWVRHAFEEVFIDRGLTNSEVLRLLERATASGIAISGGENAFHHLTKKSGLKSFVPNRHPEVGFKEVMRDTAGSAAAPAARRRKFRREISF
jgi:hypothetical protein